MTGREAGEVARLTASLSLGWIWRRDEDAAGGSEANLRIVGGPACEGSVGAIGRAAEA
jgi:hypothetical protein